MYLPKDFTSPFLWISLMILKSLVIFDDRALLPLSTSICGRFHKEHVHSKDSEFSIETSLIDGSTFDEGIKGLYRTTEADEVFCYTLLKAIVTKQ
jgi:hypothetical protein